MASDLARAPCSSQGEDPDAAWVATIVSYYFSAFMGVVTGGMGIIFVVHIIVFMLTKPPVFLFLNTAFINLDKAFALFGTLAFALFCLWLIAAVREAPPVPLLAPPGPLTVGLFLPAPRKRRRCTGP